MRVDLFLVGIVLASVILPPLYAAVSEDFPHLEGNVPQGTGYFFDFDDLDTDKDGLLSNGEFNLVPKGTDYFSTIDLNGDGVIDRNELDVWLLESQ